MYATVEDVKKRIRRVLTTDEQEACEVLLEDAALLVDSYNSKADEGAKKVVSCNIVIRALGDGTADIPIGSTQGTLSALGYSQTWTLGSGSTGELYLNKSDKRILGVGNRVGFSNPYEEDEA